jgi:hypothetical protein
MLITRVIKGGMVNKLTWSWKAIHLIIIYHTNINMKQCGMANPFEIRFEISDLSQNVYQIYNLLSYIVFL